MLSIFQKFKFNYLFRLFDKNGNGVLNETDFSALFAAMVTDGDEAKAKHAKKTARRFWLILKIYGDKNKDNTITQEEFLAWAAGFKVEGATDGKTFTRWVTSLFDAIANLDDEITAAEFQAFATAFGFGDESEGVFFAMDANDNGKITREEFSERAKEFFTGDVAPGNYLFGNLFG